MSTTAKHTPGPWATEIADHGTKRIGIVFSGRGEIAHIVPRNGKPPFVGLARFTDETDANACLIAAAPELLAELQKAHQIILNALALMTTEQKSEWARSNSRDGVIGDGTTRYHERAEAITNATKATGGAA